MKVYDDEANEVVATLSERGAIMLSIVGNCFEATAQFTYDRHGRNHFFDLVEGLKNEMRARIAPAETKEPENAE